MLVLLQEIIKCTTTNRLTFLLVHKKLKFNGQIIINIDEHIYGLCALEPEKHFIYLLFSHDIQELN